MAQQMKLGAYLCKRLIDAGCPDIFGVPGDFNLSLLNEVIDSELNYIGCTCELNAAYAADGYARLMGLAALVTTYSVGELSAINGIAGAYAESIPIVKIVGCPARKFYKTQPLLHHTLGDYMVPYKMYQHITVDQCLLNDPRTAARDLDRCLKSCIQYKRPVYIGVTSDTTDMMIDLTEGDWCNPTEPESDAATLEEALEEVVGRIAKAKRPVFFPGVELIRRNLQPYFEKLTTKSRIPYATMILSKGVISESHPHFMGLYMGMRSLPEIRQVIADSDCVIILGEKLTDFNTGGFSADVNPKKTIVINYDSIDCSSHTYHRVFIREFLIKLIDVVPVFPNPAYDYPRAKFSCAVRRDSVPVPAPKTNRVDMRYTFQKLAKTLPENCVLIAETGSSMFAAAELMLPAGALYIGQAFYGSIGYTVGSCFGVCIAAKTLSPKRRVVLCVGDGSFQLTGMEVSSMIRYKCNPIILLINNDGYTIERVITDNVYNDIQMWKYSKIPEVYGGNAGTMVQTREELDRALEKACQETDELQFIEVVLDRWDCNKLLKSAGRMMAVNNDLKASISEELIRECSY